MKQILKVNGNVYHFAVNLVVNTYCSHVEINNDKQHTCRLKSVQAVIE